MLIFLAFLHPSSIFPFKLLHKQTKKYFHLVSLCNWNWSFQSIVVLCCTCHFLGGGIDDNKSSSTSAGRVFAFRLESNICYKPFLLFFLSCLCFPVFSFLSCAGSLYCFFSEVYFRFCILIWKGKRFADHHLVNERKKIDVLSLFQFLFSSFFK